MLNTASTFLEETQVLCKGLMLSQYIQFFELIFTELFVTVLLTMNGGLNYFDDDDF